MNQNPRLCNFCDNPANSKEHVWSTWMHGLLKTGPALGYNNPIVTSFPDGTTTTSGPTNKPGSVFNIRIRAVCSTCNTGWMNRIEGKVKPFLTYMITGDPITINSEQMLFLSRWCALKFIVLEHSKVGESVTPRSDRIAFRENGTIPPYFHIYAGNHTSQTRSGAVRHAGTFSLTDERPPASLDGSGPNTQTISIILGRLFLHLNATRVGGFKIEDDTNIIPIWDRCRIWPDANASLT